jgi:hypothetical protein
MLRNAKMLCAVLLIAVAWAGSGCAYLKDRGRDAMDIVDLGITVNTQWKPQFRIYANPFVLPVGYGQLDNAKLIGWGNRDFGINDIEVEERGLLLAGREMYGVGPFDPRDFRQVSPVYAADDPEAPAERPAYKNGLLPLILDKEPRNWAKYVECDKGIHLGWIGVHFPCRPLDLIDFVLGWTTLDILHDDNLD